jgi:hypothetical protein
MIVFKDSISACLACCSKSPFWYSIWALACSEAASAAFSAPIAVMVSTGWFVMA